MSGTKTVAEKTLAAEIIQALSYLKGAEVSAEEKRRLVEVQSFQLAREAQLLREAVMLRQQREMAEYVQESIQASKAAERAEKGFPPSWG